jgi:hypothetical protein
MQKNKKKKVKPGHFSMALAMPLEAKDVTREVIAKLFKEDAGSHNHCKEFPLFFLRFFFLCLQRHWESLWLPQLQNWTRRRNWSRISR